MVKKILAAVLFALTIATYAKAPTIFIGGGVANIGKHSAAEFYSIEYQQLFSKRFGFYATADASGIEKYIGAGLSFNYSLPHHWTVGVSSGAGWYSNKPPYILGNTLEFRSSLYAIYATRHRYKLMCSVSHYSNGGTAIHNPGTEAVRIMMGIPLGRH